MKYKLTPKAKRPKTNISVIWSFLYWEKKNTKDTVNNPTNPFSSNKFNESWANGFYFSYNRINIEIIIFYKIYLFLFICIFLFLKEKKYLIWTMFTPIDNIEFCFNIMLNKVNINFLNIITFFLKKNTPYKI